MNQKMSRWIFYGNRDIRREREVLLEPKEESNPTDLTTPRSLGHRKLSGTRRYGLLSTTAMSLREKVETRRI